MTLRRYLTGVVGAAILMHSSSAFAATEQCRFIKAKAEREACYTRQENALAAKRSSAGPSSGTISEDLDRLKLENDRLTGRLKSICRGC